MFQKSAKRLKDKIQGRDSLIAEITQSTVSLLIQNGIHPKYNIISSQWEKFCDLALLTCLHRWSLESKTKAISERPHCIIWRYEQGPLSCQWNLHLVAFFLTKSINPNINWKLGILKMWIKMISGPLLLLSKKIHSFTRIFAYQFTVYFTYASIVIFTFQVLYILWSSPELHECFFEMWNAYVK